MQHGQHVKIARIQNCTHGGVRQQRRQDVVRNELPAVLSHRVRQNRRGSHPPRPRLAAADAGIDRSGVAHIAAGAQRQYGRTREGGVDILDSGSEECLHGCSEIEGKHPRAQSAHCRRRDSCRRILLFLLLVQTNAAPFPLEERWRGAAAIIAAHGPRRYPDGNASSRAILQRRF